MDELKKAHRRDSFGAAIPFVLPVSRAAHQRAFFMTCARWRHKVRGAAGAQEHWSPLRRTRDGVLELRQLARRAGLRGVRNEGGAQGSCEEDGRVARRRMLRRLILWRRCGEGVSLLVLAEDHGEAGAVPTSPCHDSKAVDLAALLLEHTRAQVSFSLAQRSSEAVNPCPGTSPRPPFSAI